MSLSVYNYAFLLITLLGNQASISPIDPISLPNSTLTETAA